mmetsp:Transcript_72244/g.143348  ORF Transcript_72244/g.143348 Transcript_72244/m.143348 type:complete len:209 (-) Transcript_72244:2298-2924(-)
MSKCSLNHSRSSGANGFRCSRQPCLAQRSTWSLAAWKVELCDLGRTRPASSSSLCNCSLLSAMSGFSFSFSSTRRMRVSSMLAWSSPPASRTRSNSSSIAVSSSRRQFFERKSIHTRTRSGEGREARRREARRMKHMKHSERPLEVQPALTKTATTCVSFTYDSSAPESARSSTSRKTTTPGRTSLRSCLIARAASWPLFQTWLMNTW